MDFGEVLSRAFQIMRRHKVLWIFGILAGCSNAGGGGGNIQSSFRQDAPPGVQQFFQQFEAIPDWQVTIIVAVIVLVILLLVVLAIFLGTMGQIGLIRGTRQVDEGASTLIFGELFSGSMPYFWRVFGLNLLFGLAAALVVLLITLPLILMTVFTLGLALICILPLVCLLIPLGWLAALILQQAIIAMVVEDLGIRAGVQRGWEVFRANLGTLILMGLILYLGVGLIGGLIISAPLALIVIPALTGVVIGTERALGGGLLTAALCFIAYLPVLIVLNGILQGYMEAAWTLTYLRLTRRPAFPQ
jgi:hypothetical protein